MQESNAQQPQSFNGKGLDILREEGVISEEAASQTKFLYFSNPNSPTCLQSLIAIAERGYLESLEKTDLPTFMLEDAKKGFYLIAEAAVKLKEVHAGSQMVNILAGCLTAYTVNPMLLFKIERAVTETIIQET